MAHAVPENEGNGQGKERRPPGFGGTIFLQQGAHVTVLDARGRIITVNDAWETFGRENGLDPAYRFVGASYVEVCERAVNAAYGSEGARDALDGVNKVLAAEKMRFSLVYPCHAPNKQRWFLMYARPITGRADGAVVSHIDVTSLHLAGLVPDETARSRGAASSERAANKLADLLFGPAPAPTMNDTWTTHCPIPPSCLEARCSIATSRSIPPATSRRFSNSSPRSGPST